MEKVFEKIYKKSVKMLNYIFSILKRVVYWMNSNLRKRKITVREIIVLILIAITIAFIWGNSLENVAQSSEKSGKVLETLTTILGSIHGREDITEHFVRKLAHFAEFSMLGFWLSLFAIIWCGSVRLQAVVNSLFVGLLIAVCDESLQLLSDRSSQVSDILLDYSGVICGTIVLLFFYWGALVIKKSVKHEAS